MLVGKLRSFFREVARGPQLRLVLSRGNGVYERENVCLCVCGNARVRRNVGALKGMWARGRAPAQRRHVRSGYFACCPVGTSDTLFEILTVHLFDTVSSRPPHSKILAETAVLPAMKSVTRRRPACLPIVHFYCAVVVAIVVEST